MKAAVALLLLLLGLLQSVASGQNTAVDKCGVSMSCFAPQSCEDGGSVHDTISIANRPISPDCKIILKLRKYTTKMYRVVIESRDTTVKEITVTKLNSPFLSCKIGAEPTFKGLLPSAYSAGEITSITNSPNSPLMCELLLKYETDIFGGWEHVKNELKTTGFTSETEESTFSKNTQIDCDLGPLFVMYEEPNASEEYVATKDKLIVGFDDLSCPEPYSIWTKMYNKKGLDEDWVETKMIHCKKENHNDEKFKFRLFRRSYLQFYSEYADKFHVRCEQKRECHLDTKEMCDAKSGCEVNYAGIPKCRSGRMTLNSKPVNITCDKATLKWTLDGAELPATSNLTCVRDVIADKKKDDGDSNTLLYTCIIVATVVCTVAVIVSVCLYKQNRKVEKLRAKMTTDKPSKSQESKGSKKEDGAATPTPLTPPVAPTPPVGPAPTAATPPPNTARELPPTVTAKDEDAEEKEAKLQRARKATATKPGLSNPNAVIIGNGASKKKETYAADDTRADVNTREAMGKTQRMDNSNAGDSTVGGDTLKDKDATGAANAKNFSCEPSTDHGGNTTEKFGSAQPMIEPPSKKATTEQSEKTVTGKK